MDAILGTAGHIDHGKTSLVRALTGINCDRLDEEKRRGITIELGFAWMDLPDGRRLGIVDVPGHERFVKNMVAGAAGIDCMLLVIAADEGIMPQTREHLDICALLGVRSGIVALTKTDMVDAEWLEMVRDDVGCGLRGTFLENAPIIPVSSASGEGLGDLRDAIFRLVASLRPEMGTDILRLPVDRVFTLKGFGTVVTGTLVSGTCGQGEDLRLMPSGLAARVRTLQVHGKQVKQAHAGQRCAMNLLGVEVGDIERGEVVTRGDSLIPSRRWIARLQCLPSAPHPLRQRMETHFHHGARECAARVIFRDRNELAPGQTAIAEFHFSEPMAGVFRDHFVLRAHSPLRTIGGGILLDPVPPVLRARDPLFKRKFAIYGKLGEASIGNFRPDEAGEIVKMALALSDAPGTDEKLLAARTGLPAKLLATELEKAKAGGYAICWDSHNWIGKEAFDACLEKCEKRARQLHEREPLKSFFAHNALCAGWGDGLPARFTQKILEAAISRGILKAESNGLKLASHKITHDTAQAEILGRLLDAYRKNGATPPTLKEIQAETGEDMKKLLSLAAHLCDTRELVKIQDGMYYHRPVLENILNKAREWFNSHETLDVAGMKTMLDVSRKYAIPLMEYMDASGMTIRLGNARKLRGDFRQGKSQEPA